MTIKEARKILGKGCKNLPDHLIEQDIRTATLLKDLFFDVLQNAQGKLLANTTR